LDIWQKFAIGSNWQKLSYFFKLFDLMMEFLEFLPKLNQLRIKLVFSWQNLEFYNKFA